MFAQLRSQLRQSPIVFILAGCFLLAVILLIDAVPFLRGGFGWQWRLERVAFTDVLPLIAIVIVYLSVGWLLKRFETRWLIVWVMLGVLAVSWGSLRLRAEDPFAELVARTMSPSATGTHAISVELSPDDPGWREWPTVMERFEGSIAHVTLAPPALPLIYASLSRLLDGAPALAHSLQLPLITYQCSQYQYLAYTPGEWASVWLGILMPLWAAIGVLPLAAAARRTVSEKTFRLVLLAFPLIPSLTLFAGTWNTIYPLMSLVAYVAFMHGLEGRRGLWIALAGFFTGLWIFTNFAFVPLILFFGVLTLVHWFFRQPRESFANPVLAGVWFGAGLAVPWIIYIVLTGQTPWSLLAVSMNQHLALERDFLPWLWLHFWDWALWTGLPLIVLWLVAVARWRSRTSPPVLALSLLITIVVLLITNVARGETGRVWLLFAPFALVAAFDGLERLRATGPGRAALMVVQATWLIVLGVTLVAVEHRLPSRPEAPQVISHEHTLNASFDAGFDLIGWSASQSDEGVRLTLNWRASQQMIQPYWFSALLVDEAGVPVQDAIVWMPDEVRYPTTCWRPGEIVSDQVLIPLGEDVAQGNYWISLAAFSDDLGLDRLTVTSGASTDTQIGFGAVSIR